MYKCVNTNRKQILNKLLVRMKNRFSKMGKSLLGAMCLLSTCGLTYSCSDDYDLDETMPSFLGGSIYDELKARNFTTVVRLADDLGYANVLSRTGSKTLLLLTTRLIESFSKQLTGRMVMAILFVAMTNCLWRRRRCSSLPPCSTMLMSWKCCRIQLAAVL